jgi:hypothetical protein
MFGDFLQSLEAGRMAVNLPMHVVFRVLEVFGVLDVRLFQAYALNPGFLIYELGSGIRGVVRYNSHRNITICGSDSDGRNSARVPQSRDGRNPICNSLRVGRVPDCSSLCRW